MVNQFIHRNISPLKITLQLVTSGYGIPVLTSTVETSFINQKHDYISSKKGKSVVTKTFGLFIMFFFSKYRK